MWGNNINCTGTVLNGFVVGLCLYDMQADYGDIFAHPIQRGFDFWCLIHEMQNDQSCFMHNLEIIVECYKSGALFGLSVRETDSMFQRGARNDVLFCRDLYGKPSMYLLPCFCVKSGTTVEICWVHSRARRIGIGKKLMELLRIENANNPLSDSLPFWKSCGIHLVSKNH